MSSHLRLSFRRIGADLLIEESRRELFSIDVQNTKDGEKFIISGRDLGREDIKILDVEPEQKHLLLMWRERETGTKHKFLAGRDERHFFVAAVPDDPTKSKTGSYGVKSVHDAMEALKPEAVKDRERKAALKGEARRERHSPARKRQGEWFFVPIWNRLKVDPMRVFKNEPIVRGRGKPHKCEFLCRFGGEQVRVSSKYPNGITEVEYLALIKKNPSKKKLSWRTMVRDARVYARGRISHPDHATLDLGREWHEVLPNRENEAPSMRHMRFLD